MFKLLNQIHTRISYCGLNPVVRLYYHSLPDTSARVGQEHRPLQGWGQPEDCHHVLYQRCSKCGTWGGQLTSINLKNDCFCTEHWHFSKSWTSLSAILNIIVFCWNSAKGRALLLWTGKSWVSSSSKVWIPDVGDPASHRQAKRSWERNSWQVGDSYLDS